MFYDAATPPPRQRLLPLLLLQIRTRSGYIMSLSTPHQQAAHARFSISI
jgi:hypothetical protein